MNNNPYPNYQASPYSSAGAGQTANQNNNFYQKPQLMRPRINGLEIIVIIISIISLISVATFGFINRDRQNRDQQRGFFVNEVVSALDQYYKNSSTIPSNRSYPKSVCSGDLNEVDFELTLRNHLTGLVPERDNHVYIQPNLFPSDPWGKYTVNIEQRPFVHRCANTLNLSQSGPIYQDSRQACLFRPSLGYSSCFLYNSVNGDKYQIGYFSEAGNQFVVFEKFREQPIIQGYSKF